MFRISDHLNLAKIDPAWRNVSCVDVAKNFTNCDQVYGLFMRGPSTIYFLVPELDSSVIPLSSDIVKLDCTHGQLISCENK